MPENLFAACRLEGELIPKRVQLEGPVQTQVEAIFSEQCDQFFASVTDEVPFDGQWQPDENELLTIDIPPEAEIFVNTIESNAISIDPIDTGNFADEGIRAIFAGKPLGRATRVLVQRFTSGQVLSKKLAFIDLQADNRFRRLENPAFTLDTSLTCIVEGGQIKFKSQQKLRSIIELTEIYREATDGEVREFAAHPKLDVTDVEFFVQDTDQTIRKLIRAVTTEGILDEYSSVDIQEAAQATELNVSVRDDRIVMPTGRSEVKSLLQFLNESRYSGPLSGQPYVTNSRKPALQTR